MAMSPVGAAATTAQRQDRAVANDTIKPIIIDPHPHPEADQAGWDGGGERGENEAAAGGNEPRGLVVIGRSSGRQRVQGRGFQAHHLAAPGIATTDEVGDPGAVGVETSEVGASPEQKSLGNTTLEMPMLALHRTPLMRHTGVVAGRRHAVMDTEGLVAPCLIETRIVIEVAEGGGQAVRTMFGG